MSQEYPATWWFRLASKVLPSRCREVPHPIDVDRILIRQFAIIKKHCYLRQLASGGGEDWLHSHPWTMGTVAIGLSGEVGENLMGSKAVRFHRAPYFRYMGPWFIHSIFPAGPGHTSVFIGLGKKVDCECPLPRPTRWSKFIKRMVRRL